MTVRTDFQGLAIAAIEGKRIGPYRKRTHLAVRALGLETEKLKNSCFFLAYGLLSIACWMDLDINVHMTLSERLEETLLTGIPGAETC